MAETSCGGVCPVCGCQLEEELPIHRLRHIECPVCGTDLVLAPSGETWLESKMEGGDGR